jgi:hypothetical protein
MRHIKIITFTQLLCAIFVAIFISSYYSITQNKNPIPGFFAFLPIAIISLPTLIFISAYHFILEYFTSKSISKHLSNKIIIVLALTIVYNLFFNIILTRPSSIISLLESAFWGLIFCLASILCYELSLRLFKRWNWSLEKKEDSVKILK